MTDRLLAALLAASGGKVIQSIFSVTYPVNTNVCPTD